MGGGAIGAAIAYGLAKNGQSVVVLDGEDTALRAARGNAGLVWYQFKGLGFQPYADISLEATKHWPDFADELAARSGITLHYEKPGGIELCANEVELEQVSAELEQLRKQSPGGHYDSQLIDRQALQEMIPALKLGADVAGAAYSPHDGMVYAPALLRALHTVILQLGCRIFPDHKVTAIEANGQSYVVRAGDRQFAAEKVVLAAGLGLAPLGELLDTPIPVTPERGQLIVTQSLPPVIRYPSGGIRQTPAGNLLLGTSNEDAGYDETVEVSVIQNIAAKWAHTFPDLENVGIVRTWAALRPMTPDGFPVYQELENHRGIFVVTSHSGITLASLNSGLVARWIIDGSASNDLAAFSLDRFDKARGESNV